MKPSETTKTMEAIEAPEQENASVTAHEWPEAGIGPETSSEHADAPVEPVAPIEAPIAYDLVIEYVPIDEIKEYENNPRRNDEAVEAVVNSIREFGFKVPMVIDRESVIVAGHTRFKAARKLGLDKLPCIRATNLSPEQIKAFRLADNKLAELSGWDRELLEKELAELAASGLNMEQFGFLDTMSDEEVDSFFTGISPEPKEPKKQTVTCPHCGKTFEIDVP